MKIGNRWRNEIIRIIYIYIYKLADLPKGRKLVSGKLMYFIKEDPDNPTCKACYLAKGYSQTHGINYVKHFRRQSIQILMQLAVNYGLFTHKMDVKKAYLHSQIDFDIYISKAKGYFVMGRWYNYFKSFTKCIKRSYKWIKFKFNMKDLGKL